MGERFIYLSFVLLTAPCSAEAAIALRQRLNETIEQFETLRKEHAELEIKFDTLGKELTVAKSNRESLLYKSLSHFSILYSQLGQ